MRVGGAQTSIDNTGLTNRGPGTRTAAARSLVVLNEMVVA